MTTFINPFPFTFIDFKKMFQRAMDAAQVTSPYGEVICPVISLFNSSHEYNAVITHQSGEKGKIVVKAINDIPAGSAINLFYGHNDYTDIMSHGKVFPFSSLEFNNLVLG